MSGRASFSTCRPARRAPTCCWSRRWPSGSGSRLPASRSAGLEKLKATRSTIPAVTHVDYSARLQTVDPERHGRLYRLLRAFEAKTGCPVMINTSFNVRGEPIVCGPEDAYRCFLATNMDVLVLEQFVLMKEEQPNTAEHRIGDYLTRFAPD